MLDDTQHLLEAEYEEEYDDEEYEFEDEYDDEFDGEGPFDEATEMELAAELLTLGSDEELEYFLGKVFKRAVRGVKRFAKSKVGRAVGGALRGIARKALPFAGKAVGGFFGGPVGAALGGKLAGAGGRLFGLELEGLSPEDQEFEVARRYVRLAGEAAQQAAKAPARAPARAVARTALKKAAQKHAPGLLKPRYGGPPSLRAGRRRTGRWVRKGRSLILLGV